EAARLAVHVHPVDGVGIDALHRERLRAADLHPDPRLPGRRIAAGVEDGEALGARLPPEGGVRPLRGEAGRHPPPGVKRGVTAAPGGSGGTVTKAPRTTCTSSSAPSQTLPNGCRCSSTIESMGRLVGFVTVTVRPSSRVAKTRASWSAMRW